MMKANRAREIQLKFRVTPQERSMIEKRMEQVGTTNMAAYLRKMSIDGYVLRMDLPELKELVSLLRRCGNNLNQVAKRVNQTGRVYTEDLEHLSEQLDRLWESANQIITALASVN